MLSEEDFKYKYLQEPITFLTEENLDKLETHCRKAVSFERGVEHKVVLELLERYYQYQKEIQDKNNEIIKLQKENEILKRAFDKQTADMSNNLLELQQKDKYIKDSEDITKEMGNDINGLLLEIKEKDKQIIELNKYLERISQDLDNVAIDQIPIAIAELKYQNKLKNKQIHIMARAFKQDDVRSVEEIKQYFERKVEDEKI